jgi:putative ABC transport system permease protein
MILRNMERRPWRTALSIGGVAAAVAIVVLGNFFRDAIEVIVDGQFNVAMRSDVAVWMAEPRRRRARLELARLPGVTQVESTRFVPSRSSTATARAQPDPRLRRRAELYRVVDADNHATAGGRRPGDDRPPGRQAGLRVGDTVLAEVLEGRRARCAHGGRHGARDDGPERLHGPRGAEPRAGRRRPVQRLRAGARARPRGGLLEATRALPRVAGAFSKASMLRNMQEISARNIRIMSTVLTPSPRSSRSAWSTTTRASRWPSAGWELASLRVLGFTRAEVSALLLGELAIVIGVALPLGMALGWGLVHLIAGLMASDQFYFPVVILPRTYAWAALCVVAAGVASALVVRRRIDRSTWWRP